MPKPFVSLQCFPTSSTHEHDTRNANNIYTIYTRTRIACKCIRSQLPILLINTPDIILSKINTHNIQGFPFLSRDITYHNEQLSDMSHMTEVVLYATIGFKRFPYLTTSYYVIACRIFAPSNSRSVHRLIINNGTIMTNSFCLNAISTKPYFHSGFIVLDFIYVCMCVCVQVP